MLEQDVVHENDGWSAALHNDTLMQAQYLDDLRHSQLNPEKRLMLAILQDAVACYRRNSGMQLGKRRQLFMEVENWINDKDNESIFSFTNVCETLGINPDYLSRGLSRQRDTGDNGPRIRYLRLDARSRRRSQRKRPPTSTTVVSGL